MIQNFSLHEFWRRDRNCKITLWEILSIPEQYFRVLFEDFPSSFFLLVFLCSKGLRIRLFASLSSVSLHQWKVYEPLMFQRGLWGRKREKVTEVSPQRWPKSWCLQKKVSEIQIFILGILTGFSGFLEKIRADNTPYHIVSHLWRYTTNCLWCFLWLGTCIRLPRIFCTTFLGHHCL